MNRDLFSQPRYFYWQDNDQADLTEHLKSVLTQKPRLTPETLLDVMGIPNGSTLTITLEDDASMIVSAHHKEIGLTTLYTLVHLDNEQWRLTLQNIFIKPEYQQKKLATIIFLHSFTAATRLGFQSI